MILTLKRAGTFKCMWNSGEGVCGHGQPGPQEYNYVCEIETNAGLDENGFIVDQLDVNHTFQTMFWPLGVSPISCERLAVHAVYQIKDLVSKNMNVKIYRVTVGIGVIPPKGVKGEALISATWSEWLYEKDLTPTFRLDIKD